MSSIQVNREKTLKILIDVNINYVYKFIMIKI